MKWYEVGFQLMGMYRFNDSGQKMKIDFMKKNGITAPMDMPSTSEK